MQTKQVKMPDGHVIYNVPQDVDDEEVIAKYKSKQSKIETMEVPEEVEQPEEVVAPVASVAEEEPEGEVSTDLARVVVGSAKDIASFPARAANWLSESLGGGEVVPKWFLDEVPRSVVSSIPFVGEGLEKKIFDQETGKVAETETAIGLGAEIGTLIVGATAVSKFDTMQKLPTMINALVSGAVADQVLSDADENIFNVAKDVMDTQDPQAVAERGLAQRTLYAVSDALAATEEDSDAMKQVKLLAEGMSIGLLGEVLGGVPELARRTRRMFKKPYTELTPEQQGEIMVDYLKEARETADLQKPEAEIVYNETPEGAAQVKQQESSGLNRFFRQTFTSRGFWTPKAYNAFEDAQYAQRQAVQQAENIATRLQKSLKSLGSDEAIAAESDKVQRVLTEDLSLQNFSREEKIGIISEGFDLSPETAEAVLDARELIDKMSESLVGSSSVPQEVKDIIAENSGEYIRRSYRLYEDTGYMPSENVIHDAREYLASNFQINNKNISVDEAYAKADEQISQIIGGTPEERSKVFEYYASVRKVNTEIIAGRKDIPEPIRKLMGEIEEPSENIILTVSKMSRLYETNKFFENLNKLGRTGNYIFNSGEVKPEGIEWVEIKGTNSVLDGKWTTPQMVDAIREQQVTWGKGFLESSGYKNFLTAKAFSQKAKTVYSHVTHLRNFIGGAQFGTANGINPFGEGAVETIKTLKNQIARGGDAELNALYEKYLRLGVIHTNVKVNEFRDLLDLGYSSNADNLLDNISQKLQGYGISKSLQDKPTEIYLATDDFFKMVNYNSELDTLKRAFPDADEATLEAEAAKIIQSTLPNYDRVPNNIKQTKILPIGSFVSFPAEIVRTSINIVKQASREINSGSDILKERGVKRLAGYATTLSGWGGLSAATYNMAGFNSEEQEAIHRLSATPWSKDSPRLVMKGEDGKIFLADTQFLDSYSIIKEPFLAVMRQIEDGQLQGKDLDDYMVNAISEFATVSLRPYIDESILTTALTDIVYAAKDEGGRTPSGKAIFTPGMETSEKAAEMAYHIFDSFLPGTFNSLKGLAEAAIETPNATTGRPKSLSSEFTTNVTGVKFTEFNAKDALTFAVKNHNYNLRNIISDTPNYAKDSDELVRQYTNRQKKRYELTQQLHLKVEASRTLLGDGQTSVILRDAGLSKDDIKYLYGNIFKPEKQTLRDWQAIVRKTPKGEDESTAEVAKRLTDVYASIVGTPLTYVEKTKKAKKKEEEREEFSKGGEVNVPQAPDEPDERIDKMTGLPYNAQAGSIMSEPEDRMGFSKGGKAAKAMVDAYEEIVDEGSKLYKTLKEKLGEYFEDDEIARVADDIETQAKGGFDDPYAGIDDMDYGYDMPTDMGDDETIDEYLARSADVFLDEKIDRTVPQLQAEFGDKWERYINEGEWEEFSRARGYSEDQIKRYAEHTDMQDELDYDGSLYSVVADNLKDLRQTKEALGFNAPEVEASSEQIATLSDMMNFYMRNNDAIAFVKDEKIPELGKRQVNRLFADPDLAPLMNELAEEIPTDIKMSERVAKPLPPKEREAAKEAFLADSIEKKPIYRGITTFENKNFDIAFAMPRELGAHVGTAGQANTVVARTLDKTSAAEMQFTAPARGFEPIEPEEWDQFYEEMAMDRAMDQQFAADEGIALTDPEPAIISKGYIRVKNPLVIEQDLGSWDATDIIIDDNVRKIFEDGIAQQFNGEMPEELASEIDRLGKIAYDVKIKGSDLADNVQDPQLEMMRVYVNRKFRDVLQKAGYDSIKYENLIEGTNVGEDEWSYILFKPQQYKAETAKSFDVNDKRFTYFLGGLVQKAVGIKEEDVEWAKKIGESYGKDEELDGKGDAARHLALGWLAKKAKYPDAASFAINAREILNSGFEKEMDVYNNDLGFRLEAGSQDEAEQAIRRMIDEKAAKYYTIEESRKARGYAEGGEVVGDYMSTYNSIMEGLRG